MSSYFQNLGAFVRECSGKPLHYDEACLQIIAEEKISFWSQYDECEGCILLETKKEPGMDAYVLKTHSPVHYEVRNGNGQICNGTYQFGEYGQYTLNISQGTTARCKPRMTAEPDAACLQILTAAVVLLALAICWYIVKVIGKRFVAGRFYARYFAREDKELGSKTRVSEKKNRKSRPTEDNELGSETLVSTAEASVQRSLIRARLRSLDIFRGITIALMLFVHAGGGGYQIFSHSVWNGITVADVVFPWFAFTMGEALVLSLNARLRTAMPRVTAFKQVARRALLMSLIGIVLGSVFCTLGSVRLPGVLQRLAAMYLVVAALECAFMRTDQDITRGRSLFRDISAGWQQWLATLLLVAIQVCVTLLVPAPGCPPRYMGPGGLHLSALGMNLTNCTGGIAGYIDRKVFGPSHLHTGHVYGKLYHSTVRHDPEGLLGILSGVLVVQSGAHAARVMLVYNHARARIMRWVFWSIVFGIFGGGLSMFSKNDGPIPINKYLWSVSYCLVCASTALFAQAVLYFIVDLKNKWGGRPLCYAGQNSLFLYVGSQLLKFNFPFYWAIPAPTHSELLAVHTGAVLLWLAVGVALHKKRVFITL